MPLRKGNSGASSSCPLPLGARGVSARTLWPVYFFVLKLAIVYGLLLIPWPGVMAAYRAAYCAGGNIFFRTLGGAGRVYFTPSEQIVAKDKDVSARLENIATHTGGVMEISSRSMGYLPTSFAMALVVAAPIPWKRRAISLFWGIALISVYVGVELWLRLVNLFSGADVMAVYTLGPFWKGLVMVLVKVLGMSPVTAYIAPVVIWTLVCFRREDLVRIVAQISGSGAGEASQALKP